MKKQTMQHEGRTFKLTQCNRRKGERVWVLRCTDFPEDGDASNLSWPTVDDVFELTGCAVDWDCGRDLLELVLTEVTLANPPAFMRGPEGA